MEALAEYSGSSSRPSSPAPSASSPPAGASPPGEEPPGEEPPGGALPGAGLPEGSAGGLPDWVLQAPAGSAAPEAAARVARAARAGASLLEELGRRRAARNPSFAETLAAHLGVDPWGSRVAAPPPDPSDYYDALAKEVEAHAARVRRGEIPAPGLEEPLPTVAFTPPAPASVDPCFEAAAAAAARISARFAGGHGVGQAGGEP